MAWRGDSRQGKDNFNMIKITIRYDEGNMSREEINSYFEAVAAGHLIVSNDKGKGCNFEIDTRDFDCKIERTPETRKFNDV